VASSVPPAPTISDVTWWVAALVMSTVAVVPASPATVSVRSRCPFCSVIPPKVEPDSISSELAPPPNMMSPTITGSAPAAVRLSLPTVCEVLMV